MEARLPAQKYARQHKSIHAREHEKHACIETADGMKGSGHKVVVLRYNPDSFRIDGMNFSVTTKERQRRLVDVVHAWLLEDPAPGKQLARFFMC